jgi:hypothetical protein
MNATQFEAALQTLLGDEENKEMLVEGILLDPSMDNNFTTNLDMKLGMICPILSMDSGLRPFNTTFTGTDTTAMGAKTDQLKKVKIEHKLLPSEWYNHFKKFNKNVSLTPTGNENSDVVRFVLDAIALIETMKIRNSLIWKASYNAASATPLACFNGFEKIIIDAIDDEILPPEQVATLGTVSESNVLDCFDELLDLMSEEYLQQADMQFLCSRKVVNWYIKTYQQSHNGISPQLIMGQPLFQGVDQLTGIKNNMRNGEQIIGVYHDSGVPIKMEQSMSIVKSKSIIATSQGNLQIGSSKKDFKGYDLDVQKENYHVKLMGAFEMNCGIYELGKGAIAVNMED